jgi:hypothetical protein
MCGMKVRELQPLLKNQHERACNGLLKKDIDEFPCDCCYEGEQNIPRPTYGFAHAVPTIWSERRKMLPPSACASTGRVITRNITISARKARPSLMNAAVRMSFSPARATCELLPGRLRFSEFLQRRFELAFPINPVSPRIDRDDTEC